uniref:Uncharacterized protein LOC114343427 n=1 Tax=Diabrotica virgifera virgifera TaxID=50390 RepID=A0A6P7GVK5_DIAVI
MKYYSVYRDRVITKQRFGAIFSTVWDKTMTPSNIKSGFSSTGIYPFNPEAIPEIAFAPSTITYQHQEDKENVTLSETNVDNKADDCIPSTSGMQQKDYRCHSTLGLQPKNSSKELGLETDSSNSCRPSTSGIQSKNRPKNPFQTLIVATPVVPLLRVFNRKIARKTLSKH